MRQLRNKKGKVSAIIFTVHAILIPCFAKAATVSVPAIPQSLTVPKNQKPAMAAQGIGVQIYECREDNNDSSKFEWVFKAPEAVLFDSADNRIGKHYAGPTWESNDGSKVIGEVQATYNSPETNSIPWLLLKAKANSGSGIFSRVLSIQRINTVGGKAASEICDKDQMGREMRVPYKAMYYFYVSQP